MAEIFDFDVWSQIADEVKRLNIDRDVLLAGMPMSVLQALPRAGAYATQIDLDVDWLNRRDAAISGMLAIERWLRNAARHSEFDAEAAKRFRAWADQANERVKPKPVAGSPPAEAASAAATLDVVLPQRFIFESDLLPIGFLTGAALAARSVGRISVTRYENGAVRKSPATNLPVRYLGTCWLIGPKHIITNHHVIAARSPGEAAANEADFALQAINSKIDFDYDDIAVPAGTLGCASLLTHDQSLDFAVIELSENALGDRSPLTLSRETIEIDNGAYLPVNIVQHPGGQTKQIALRNNAAVKIDEQNLSYFTDTQPGSSGSPVCDDRWKVVALHKAAHRHTGKFTYQGRETAWVNVGTPITSIIEEIGEKMLADIRAVAV